MYYSKYYPYYRPYPPVNADYFTSSATQMDAVLDDGKVITEKLKKSKSFATSLMSAAQESNSEEVKRLLTKLDLQSDISVKFTPDALTVILARQQSKINLCYRW